MSSRGKMPPAREGRSVQAPGMMRHGPFPGLGPPGHRPFEPLPHPGSQADIDRLAGDNHRLAATHGVLRQELVAAQQEIQRVKAHIRSIQTESDIQIRVLLDRIAKMEVDIRAGDSLKKDLQQAHMEAQGLVKARQELTTQIQQATQELQKAHADVKKLPELHAELDSLRQEHQRLRVKFEYEKGLNIEQVEQMQAMEKNLVGMAREMEKLRAEVLNAEKRASGPIPYGGPYVNPDPSYPPHVGAYVDGYGRPHVQMGVGPAGEGMIPYGSVNNAPPGGVGAAVLSPGNGAVWGTAYDTSSLAWR